MLQVAITDDDVTCVNVKLPETNPADPNKDAAPYYTTAGDCVYNTALGNNAPSCSAEPAATSKRFCPCAKTGLQWFKAGAGQSCTDACQARGGICGDQADVWPKDEPALKAILPYIDGIKCESTNHKGDSSFSPSIASDGKCYYATDDTAKQPFCDATDWKQTGATRICPCWDVSQVV